MTASTKQLKPASRPSQLLALDRAVRRLAAGVTEGNESLARLGCLTFAASPDGAMVFSANRILYQAEQGGRRVLAFEPGAWVQVALCRAGQMQDKQLAQPCCA